MLVEKLTNPMPAAMPCRLQLSQHWETCGTVGQHKTKYACIDEADESLRIRMERSQSKNYEDHIAGKGLNSLSTFILCTNLFLCLKLWKYQMQRQQWRKNGKIGEHIGMAADESQKQKWGDRWSKDQGPYCLFCVVNGYLSSQEFGGGAKIQKYKGRVVLRGDIVKDDSG